MVQQYKCTNPTGSLGATRSGGSCGKSGFTGRKIYTCEITGWTLKNTCHCAGEISVTNTGRYCLKNPCKKHRNKRACHTGPCSWRSGKCIWGGPH